MRKERLTSFTIHSVQSTLHNLEFSIVVQPGMELNDKEKDALIQSYINYHLAIKPNVAILLFQLDNMRDVGQKLHGGNYNAPAIYHIPPREYPYLEAMVADAPFIVSNTYLVEIINSNYLNKSVFAILPQWQQENGLNVLGIPKIYETTEA